MSKTEGLVLAGAGAVAALALLSRRKGKRRTTPKPLPPPVSPFLAGSHCSVLADAAATEQWLKTKVVPEVVPRLEAFAVPLHQQEQARGVVRQLVDEVFAATLPECPVVQTRAARQVWKGL